MGLIHTVWWNVLGVVLFVSVFAALVWCLYDARREAELEGEYEYQREHIADERVYDF